MDIPSTDVKAGTYVGLHWKCVTTKWPIEKYKTRTQNTLKGSRVTFNIKNGKNQIAYIDTDVLQF